MLSSDQIRVRRPCSTWVPRFGSLPIRQVVDRGFPAVTPVFDLRVGSGRDPNRITGICLRLRMVPLIWCPLSKARLSIPSLPKSRGRSPEIRLFRRSRCIKLDILVSDAGIVPEMRLSATFNTVNLWSLLMPAGIGPESLFPIRSKIRFTLLCLRSCFLLLLGNLCKIGRTPWKFNFINLKICQS